jgi:hypothetical protein
MRSAHRDVRFVICSPRTDPREVMVGLGGLEPPTSPLSGARSNHLSYRPNVKDVAWPNRRPWIYAGVLCGDLGRK